MPGDDLRERIAGQFSYRDERADVWRALELVLDTDRYLNLGYSPRFWPTLLGSSQRRLVDYVGAHLAARLPATEGVRLLDVGCGRGGPAVRLAERYGFCVLGVDLVPYNLARARSNAEGADASFVVGDAAGLPVSDGAVPAATAIDALVYLPERTAVVDELARVLGDGGLLVVSDLLARSHPKDEERTALDAFASAWDMPPLSTASEFERDLESGGFAVRRVSDVTPHSVGRFRRWTTLYRLVAGGPLGPLLERRLRSVGLDPETIDRQVRRAHGALPSLRHVMVEAEAG